MSEFSESFHLYADDPNVAVQLLVGAKVAGFVFPSNANANVNANANASVNAGAGPQAGWTAFVYEPDEPPSRANFDAILAAAPGRLVHWDYAEDHACTVNVYEAGKKVARLRVSFESRQAAFDRDAFVALGLLEAKAADRVAEWLSFAIPGYLVAEQIGLSSYKWISFEYARSMKMKKSLPSGVVEVEQSGAVHGAGNEDEPPLVLADVAGATRWDTLASTLVQSWMASGAIELEEGASASDLADALADLLSDEPAPSAIEEFLLDREDVAEVFASGAELVRAARAG